MLLSREGDLGEVGRLGPGLQFSDFLTQPIHQFQSFFLQQHSAIETRVEATIKPDLPAGQRCFHIRHSSHLFTFLL